MGGSKEPSRTDLVALDIDERMSVLWGELMETPEVGLTDDDEVVRMTRKRLLELMGAYMRAAYGRGYTDALVDEGLLMKDHGYKMPLPRGPVTDGATKPLAAEETDAAQG